MNDSLRVKDVVNSDDGDNSATVKIKENSGELPKRAKSKAKLNIREMWANAFLRKKSGFEEVKPVTVKQKAPAPFVYLKLFVMLAFLFIVLLSVFYLFKAYEMFPFIAAIMVLVVPVTLTVFFYEMDTSKRLSSYNVFLLFFISAIFALAIKFVSYSFIYEMNGKAISYFGSLAIGVMEAVVILTLCIGCIGRMKIKDVITGIFAGVIIGVGFAVVNSAIECFKDIFIETQYAPTVEALIYNETLLTVVNGLFPTFIFEFVLHALTYILCGAIAGGMFVIIKNRGTKERSVFISFAIIVAVVLVMCTLWIIPFAFVPDLFIYILRALMMVTLFMIIIKLIRVGLAENDYE